jgi:hypothetical protein
VEEGRLRQHGNQGRHAKGNTGGEEAAEHQGFEFHGRSPVNEAFEDDVAKLMPTPSKRENSTEIAIF